MEEYKEIFNPKELDDFQLGQIEYILTHPAYQEHFRPYMQQMHDACVRLWKIPEAMRSTPLTDQDLQSGARFIEGFMLFFDRLVEETREERILRARGLTTEPHVAARQEGTIGSPPAFPGEPDYDAQQDF